MKTLDEVIDALERCYTPHVFDCKGCPYEDDDSEVECRSDDRDTDVLNYLKTYRADKLEWEQTREANEERYQEAVRNCERAENKFIARLKELNVGTLNPPLTWTELKGMVGKPVWFEGYAGNFWCIVREMQKNSDGTEDVIFDGPHGMTGVGHDDQYGDKWQVYRKERS